MTFYSALTLARLSPPCPHGAAGTHGVPSAAPMDLSTRPGNQGAVSYKWPLPPPHCTYPAPVIRQCNNMVNYCKACKHHSCLEADTYTYRNYLHISCYIKLLITCRLILTIHTFLMQCSFIVYWVEFFFMHTYVILPCAFIAFSVSIVIVLSTYVIPVYC